MWSSYDDDHARPTLLDRYLYQGDRCRAGDGRRPVPPAHQSDDARLARDVSDAAGAERRPARLDRDPSAGCGESVVTEHEAVRERVPAGSRRDQALPDGRAVAQPALVIPARHRVSANLRRV